MASGQLKIDCHRVALTRRPLRRGTRGFTLIEMLIVVAIVAILFTLTIGSLMLLPERARVRSTEALIAKIDVVLNRKLSEIETRVSSIPVTSVDAFLGAGSPQHAKVIAMTRTLRQELPETFALSFPAPPNVPFPLHAPANTSTNPVLGDWSQIDLRGALPSGGSNMNGPVQAPGELPSSSRVFAAALNQAVAAGTFAAHDPKTTRAECLYLIISTAAREEGVEFGPNEVGDTDQDGLKEFLDSFGNPIHFFLFPTHYTLAQTANVPKSNRNDPNLLLTDNSAASWWRNSSDFRRPFEQLFHSVSHPYVPYQARQASLPSGVLPRSYGVRPLIISAGPDGQLGLARGPGADGQPGRAGTDDDGMNGTDDIGELGWPGTDDVDVKVIEHGVALRVTEPTADDYGLDQDNIDNLSLRAR